MDFQLLQNLLRRTRLMVKLGKHEKRRVRSTFAIKAENADSRVLKNRE